MDSHTNKTIRTLRGLLFLTPLILGANTATAERGQHESRFPIVIADVAAREAARFAEMDQDNSSSVELAEFEQAKLPRRHGKQRARKNAHYQKAHRKEGGQRVNRHRGGSAEHKAKRQEMRAAVQTELFAMLDTDNDGVLSDTEFSGKTRENTRLARKRAVFGRLDVDTNGSLTADELPSRAQRLAAADANSDGEVTRAELRAARQSRKQAG